MTEQSTYTMSDETRNNRKANFEKLVREIFPFVGLIVIFLVFAVLTEGRIMKPAAAKLILSQVYVPMIAACGVFLVMTAGGLDFSQGSILGMVSIVIS